MTRPSRNDLIKWASDVRTDIHRTQRELDNLLDLAGWIDRELAASGYIEPELRATPPRAKKYRTITTEQIRDFIRTHKRVTRKEIRIGFGVSDAQVRQKITPLLEAGTVMLIIPDDHGPHEYQYVRPSPYPGPRSRPRTEADPSAIGRGFIKRGDPVAGTGRPMDRDKFPGPTRR